MHMQQMIRLSLPQHFKRRVDNHQGDKSHPLPRVLVTREYVASGGEFRYLHD